MLEKEKQKQKSKKTWWDSGNVNNSQEEDKILNSFPTDDEKQKAPFPSEDEDSSDSWSIFGKEFQQNLKDLKTNDEFFTTPTNERSEESGSEFFTPKDDLQTDAAPILLKEYKTYISPKYDLYHQERPLPSKKSTFNP